MKNRKQLDVTQIDLGMSDSHHPSVQQMKSAGITDSLAYSHTGEEAMLPKDIQIDLTDMTGHKLVLGKNVNFQRGRYNDDESGDNTLKQLQRKKKNDNLGYSDLSIRDDLPSDSNHTFSRAPETS